MAKYGDCQKCGSKWQKLVWHNDRLVGISCGCYDEEVEKDSNKAEMDLEKVEEQRKIVAGSKNIPPSVYPE